MIAAETIIIQKQGFKIRGSVYYQSSQLVKQIFQEGAKKEDRIDPSHLYFKKVASYKTMESYRNIWNNFFNYLKEEWKVKDFEKIEPCHIEAYMDHKIEYYPSRQYIEKISASLGKLETALELFSKNIHSKEKKYDFSIRQDILDRARDLKLVASNYHDRAYINPLLLIKNLSLPLHQLVAKIQYEGGARIEGIALMKQDQLLGIVADLVTKTKKGVIFTKEKGGKEGNILVDVSTYIELEKYFLKHKTLKISRQKYYEDIKQSCIVSNEVQEGSHGLRWNFAKRRMFEYAKAIYSYEDSLKKVSHEMKHNRASITLHYI